MTVQADMTNLTDRLNVIICRALSGTAVDRRVVLGRGCGWSSERLLEALL